MKERRCYECGKGKIKLLARPGRVASYRNLANLAVPDDLEIPTCDNCGAEWTGPEFSKTIDAAMDAVYRAELRARAQRALETLERHTQQNTLERLLDLSHGYLSKLRSGEKDPSPALVTELAMLARDPKRIKEVAEYWGQDLKAS